nr:ISL3 family transposase [Clostridium sp. AF37-5AT]
MIRKVVHADSFLQIHIETRPAEQTCPCCSQKTRRIHDYRFQKIQDIPNLGKQVTLILKKRRYVCTSCGKRFLEHYSFLPSYHRRTKRLTYYVVNLLRESFSLKQVANLTGVSVQTVSRLLDTLAYEAPSKLPAAVSIDEFKGNASTGKYQCILVDPLKRRILDILPDRTQSHLASYWRNISRKERLKVQFFVCDMWRPYVDLAQTFFPNAKIIIDKYHFIRQITWAIENVRKRLQKSMPASLRKYYKRSHKLILSRYQSLSTENKQACDLMLLYSDELRFAHSMKEWFYDICHMRSYRKQRKYYKRSHKLILSRYQSLSTENKQACDLMLLYSNELRLAHSMKEWFYDICHMRSYRKQQLEFDDWIANARDSRIPEFEKCAQTCQNWRKEILNAFKYGITNGPTEGFNNKIKVLKRSSYGIRNFNRFRTRILHCTS